MGRVAFLICGDLFEDALVHRVRDRGVDLLLYPFSRCFASGLWDEEAWRAERAHYVRRAVRTGATVLMVNTLGCRELDGGTFGGALAVSRTGEILAELPPGKEGILIADL
jgi:N-carbamoylputrescine amidase